MTKVKKGKISLRTFLFIVQMKFAVALVAILATASAWEVPNLGRGELHKDLQEFVDLIPVNDVVKLLMQYVAEDVEVQNALKYMQTEEFRTLVKEVEAMPEYLNLLNYIYNAGVDVYYLVNRLHDYIHIPRLTPPGYSEYGITGGLKGLVEDIKKILPINKIKALYHQKLQTSPAFKQLIDRLSSSEFQTIVNNVYGNPRFQYLLNKAKQAGLDVNHMKYHLTFLASLVLVGVSSYPFGDNDWSMNELDHDIMDFYKTLPIDEILLVTEKYRKDPEIQATLKYVTGDEFHRLLSAVEDLPEFKNFVLYIQESGYNKIREMKAIHLLAGMKDYISSKQPNPMEEIGYGGLNGYINDIVALLPKEKIQKLHQEKLVTSPAFSKFNSYIRSEKYVQLKNALTIKDEYIELIKRSNAAGLDIEAIEKFKLILDQDSLYINISFARITMKYVLTFFAALVVVGVSAVPLNGNRTDLLNGNRSEIFARQFLDLYNDNDTENPLDKDLIDFVKLVPIDKVHDILEKYENDSKIKKSADYVQSEEFHQMIYDVEALPEHNRYVLYLQESGYDKIRELKMIHKALGMKDYVPPKPSYQVFKKDDDSEGGLTGLIKEIIGILPEKEIKELHEKKLKESPAFAKFSSYIRNEKFSKICKDLLNKPVVQKAIKESRENGIDYLMKYVLTFFAALVVVGVSAVPLNGNRTDLLNGNRSNIFSDDFWDIYNGNYTPSLEREFSDFAKLIPLDKLGEILEEYKNDGQIINGIYYLRSDKFHQLVYAIEALPEHHRYVIYLQESGFDKIRQLKLFHLIFGMKDYVPPSSHDVYKKKDNFEPGFKGFLKAYIGILPEKQIKELHEKKLKESSTFAKFSSYIRNPKFTEILKDLAEQKPVKEALEILHLVGIDFFAFVDLQLRILGFKP
ncbi:Protein G12 [Vespula squamosa]|uniref:Protein G12 n=1 Tax=Vespula squamosa TaxID=30214 RepID=A0ABD2BGG0_VESSQ